MTTTEPETITLAIEKAADGRAYIAGSCTIWLDVISATRAEVVPRTCTTTLDDGTQFRVELEEGVLQLEGERLGYVLTSTNTLAADGSSIRSTCELEGRRLD